MKKKKVLGMVTALALTAVVCIGGTLAYLSATSNTVNNAVTVGTGYTIDDDDHQGLFIDEKEYTYDEKTKKNVETDGRTEEGNTYQNLFPGDTFTKDPTVTMIGGSVQSYVFVQVTGVDELEAITAPNSTDKVFDISGWNTSAWVKLNNDGTKADVQEGNGIYVYQGGKADNSIVDVSLEAEKSHITLPEAVFGTISVNNVKELPENATVAAQNVKLTACAVQATANPQGVAAALNEVTFTK